MFLLLRFRANKKKFTKSFMNNIDYCMSNKSWPISCSKFKFGQDFLDRRLIKKIIYLNFHLQSSTLAPEVFNISCIILLIKKSYIIRKSCARLHLSIIIFFLLGLKLLCPLRHKFWHTSNVGKVFIHAYSIIVRKWKLEKN